MNQFNIPARWQRIVCSAIYSLLILSMLWVPFPTDVFASTTPAEEPSSALICQEGRRSIICTDPDTGTKVVVPSQRGVAELEVTAVSIEDMPIVSSPGDEFTAHRGVVGLSIVDSKTGEILTEFKPALRVKVEYTRSDVIQAGGLRNLTLGYFDGQKMQEFSNVRIRGNRNGGTISATVDELNFEAPVPCPDGLDSGKPGDCIEIAYSIAMGGH